MGLEFVETRQRTLSSGSIWLGKERIGEVESWEHLGRERYGVIINLRRESTFVPAKGLGDSREEAIRDALSRARLDAARIVEVVDEMMPKLFPGEGVDHGA